jgi:ATP-dependent DNA helicase
VAVLDDSICRAFFKREQWPLLVVDEGHRLKNPKCQLMAMLRRIQTSSRFLLTGTPVQNNMGEMWSLMNFLLPEIFDEPVRKNRPSLVVVHY